MKIIDNALREVMFKELEVGATFKYDEYYYIKTENVWDKTYHYNAVNFKDGNHTLFTEMVPVIPFNCELIIL